jgi:hypothetical protein
MIAIVIATAGWTTVAIMVATGRGDDASPSPSVVAAAAPSDDGSLESADAETPEPESHVSPALEAVLPKSVDGTALSSSSASGETWLVDDDWSVAISTFLQGVGKTPADLLVAQAGDPTGDIDLSVTVYTISGVSTADVQKTLITAAKAIVPTLKTTTATVGGKKVTTGDIQDTTIYWYPHDTVVYEIATADPDLAAKALAALP